MLCVLYTRLSNWRRQIEARNPDRLLSVLLVSEVSRLLNPEVAIYL
jgi:hypothetical protein